ncbi:MAG: glycosyltransferase [Prevotella sp.]|nr:glycosyltransferase [Prevotella sp.]
MTSHNSVNYIKSQIDSILSQIGDEDELIISDDGSVDGSVELIKSINDVRIRLLSFSQPHTYSNKRLPFFYLASANFANALQYAKGDCIFLADQDDVWMPNKYRVCIEALHDNDIVCHNFGIIDEDGNVLEEQHFPTGCFERLSLVGFWKYFPFRGCCLAFNKKVYNLCMPIPDGTFEHDCWIGMNSVMHNLKYKFIDTPLINYRRHSGNVSELQSPNSLMFKLYYRMVLLCRIIKYWSR